MSLTVTTGAGSLISLGLGISDVVTLTNLGKLAGNWMSASSGDRDLLDMLQEDERNFVLRKGIFDILRFRNHWSRSLRLLSNGRTEMYEGPLAVEALGECDRFTAIMICLTGALNAFNTNSTTLDIVRNLLLRLIDGGPAEEELISSQIRTRVNAWRSAACVRGLTTQIAKTRTLLMNRKSIEDGFMPSGDAPMMVDFLFWLIGETSETYTTSSSDVAGVAYCLTSLGFDTLGVEGLPNIGDDPGRMHPCLLIYNHTPLPKRLSGLVYALPVPERRNVNTVIPLSHPEESVSSFPISTALANRVRTAWKSGAEAGSVVFLQPMTLDYDDIQKAGYDYDVRYIVASTGSEPPRARTSIHKFASSLSFNVNRELVSALDSVIGELDDDKLEKLHELIVYPVNRSIGDLTVTMEDGDSFIEKFTEFQAFFMGYYYEVLLRLVDTSELELQCVEGMWGFGSNSLLAESQDIISKSKRSGLTRELVIRLLSLCCLGYSAPLKDVGHERFSWCLGVVHNRALLTNGLVGESDTPLGVAQFKLFDADTSGIPTDTYGLIRPGVAHWLQTERKNQIETVVSASGPSADLTKHIEADWEGDPRRLLLCFRYNGRRIATINPALADMGVCASYTEPVEEPGAEVIERGVPCTLQDLQEGSFPSSPAYEVPTVFLSQGKPNMRYGVVGMLPYFDLRTVGLSSNSINAALEKSKRDIKRVSPALAITAHSIIIC
ncbi:hypothetical protein F5882DRAFT_422203 [Hyaloscypha sp. PMI_1271]|nr:hypothetical protein F5882DRAFT_422203 [Hyaloscypha sp. PMI_1271]